MRGKPLAPIPSLAPPGGLLGLQEFLLGSIHTHTNPLHFSIAFKGLREILAAVLHPARRARRLAGCSRESAAASAARPHPPHYPPPVLQSGGSLHACLDLSITRTPTTPARARRPYPCPPACTVPSGQNLGSVTAPKGWGESLQPRAARSAPRVLPGPWRYRQPDCRDTVTALRAGQSYFYLV